MLFQTGTSSIRSAVALFGLLAQRVELLFADMFLFCAAMFLVPATASGLVNRLVPGYAYRYWGRQGFLLVLLLVTTLALGCLALMKGRGDAG